MKKKVLIIGAVWLAVALVLSATGAIARLRPPLPQAILFTLTASLLLAFGTVTAFRDWLLALPLPKKGCDGSTHTNREEH